MDNDLQGFGEGSVVVGLGYVEGAIDVDGPVEVAVRVTESKVELQEEKLVWERETSEGEDERFAFSGSKLVEFEVF